MKTLNSVLETPLRAPGPGSIGHRLRDLRGTLGAKWSVAVLLLPLVVFGGLLFGPRAWVVIGLSVLCCLAANVLPRVISGSPWRLFNPSTVVTGLLLGLTFSVDQPVYMIVVGALVAEIVAKHPLPVLGRGLFNPAALGRGAVAILETIDPPQAVDLVSESSPLMVIAGGHGAPDFLIDVFFGFTKGAIGETSAAVLLVVGALMLTFVVLKRHAAIALLISVPLLVSVMPSTPAIAGHAPWVLNPLLYLLGGSTLLMAFFFATDPASTPDTRLGGVLFGVGVAAIGVLGRLYTTIPGCEMWGILVMNMATPGLDWFARRVAGVARTSIGQAPARTPADLAEPVASFYAERPVEAASKPALQLSDSTDVLLPEAGYEAFSVLSSVLGTSNPEAICREVRAGMLGGYGGAHFPVALKWAAVRQQAGRSVLVVNGQEGEPDTFKDRYLMTHYPHLVVEGIALAACALDAEEICIVIGPDFTRQREALTAAIEDLQKTFEIRLPGGAEEAQPAPSQVPPGPSLLTEGRSFPVDGLEATFTLVSGPGLYLSGEETALLNFLEARRGEPRVRPPFPTTAGLYGRPTAVNNVETLSWLPRLIYEGGRAFADNGPFKLVSLSGAVARPGVHAVRLGSPLGDILEMGGGMAEGKSLLAFAFGGGGGLLPPDCAAVPLERAALDDAGAILGTASIRVLSSAECLVRECLSSARFFARETCGRCAPCRLGTQALAGLYQDLVDGRADRDTLARVREINATLPTSFCGLGKAVPTEFLTLQRYWPEVLEAHINGKGCPVCHG